MVVTSFLNYLLINKRKWVVKTVFKERKRCYLKRNLFDFFGFQSPFQ
uniref:Uncharacterized protein n=1 Tax=Lepeophtheirus salmonis TaxID=72036 RepID=A0A0K2TID7_LEPSM